MATLTIYAISPAMQNQYLDDALLDDGENAGVDLYIPEDVVIPPHARAMQISHRIHCHMTDKHGELMHYTLHLRSSTAAKTSLRMANSVGIIDKGYRGPIIGMVDNLSDREVRVAAGDRLMQLCHPSLKSLKVDVVDSIDKLRPSKRGHKGIGSTGK